MAINPVLYKSLPYDPHALAPVAMIADFPNVLVVGAASPDRTLKDLIERAPLLPDVPTMAEAGLPEIEMSAFLGIMTTSGTPLEIISRLETVLQKVASLPEIVMGIERQDGVVQFMASRQFGASLAAESRKWAEAVKHSGATAD